MTAVAALSSNTSSSSSTMDRHNKKRLLDRNNKNNSRELITKTAVILSIVTLLGLFVLAAVYSIPNASSYDSSLQENNGRRITTSTFVRSLLEAEDNNNNNNNDNDENDYSNYSCNHIYSITPESGDAQCAFAKTCNQGDGVWAPSVFCSKRFSRRFLCIILSPFMIVWMILLFRMLGSTAEDYFSPALEMFSVKLGLPPRFAGVSLLALGNGAADVSATVSAITSDPIAGYKLSLGALTGAAMLISCVISAVVIITAEGLPCRGALVRDVLALAFTVLVVWKELASGSIGPESVSMFLSIYCIFVLLVLAADIYHRAVVLPRMAVQAGNLELQRQLEAAEQVAPIPSQAAAPRSRWSAMLTAISNYDNVTIDQGRYAVESDDLTADRPIHLRGQGGLLDRHSHMHRDEQLPSSLPQDLSNAYSVLEDAVDHTCMHPGSHGMPADSWAEAIQDGQDELLEHAASVWDEIVADDDLRMLTKFLLLCELPFIALRKLTVPIPCEGYYVRALIALSLVISPFWLVYYLWDGHDINVFHGTGWVYLVAVESFLTLCALGILRFAPGGNGELAFWISTPIALHGFAIAATWIDTIANALVSLLTFIGIILRIPGPVIGLTILAWGNSMSDLSANVTMARKGLANMAVTACFAGPVFNVLVGLGLGFSSLAAATGNARTEVSLSPSVLTGFLFVALNSVAILGTGLWWGNGRIPKHYGYGALVLYSIYIITSISVQYSKYGDD
jgi:sodium/potassium/calcium exchanger 6